MVDIEARERRKRDAQRQAEIIKKDRDEALKPLLERVRRLGDEKRLAGRPPGWDTASDAEREQYRRQYRQKSIDLALAQDELARMRQGFDARLRRALTVD
jgi:hypothetical protein